MSNPVALQPAQARGGGHTREGVCLQLIVDETGLDVDDLSGDAAFRDLDGDSLMSISLSDRIRIELDMDIKASFLP